MSYLDLFRLRGSCATSWHVDEVHAAKGSTVGHVGVKDNCVPLRISQVNGSMDLKRSDLHLALARQNLTSAQQLGAVGKLEWGEVVSQVDLWWGGVGARCRVECGETNFRLAQSAVVGEGCVENVVALICSNRPSHNDILTSRSLNQACSKPKPTLTPRCQPNSQTPQCLSVAGLTTACVPASQQQPNSYRPAYLAAYLAACPPCYPPFLAGRIGPS